MSTPTNTNDTTTAPTAEVVYNHTTDRYDVMSGGKLKATAYEWTNASIWATDNYGAENVTIGELVR